MVTTNYQYIQAVNFNGGAASTSMLINPYGGTVAVGTAAPRNPSSLTTVLSLDGANSGVSVSAGSDANTTILSQVNADGQLNVYGSGNLKFGTANTERMRINSSGQVGIGTAAPSAYLDVFAATQPSDDLGTIRANVASTNTVSYTHLTLPTNREV